MFSLFQGFAEEAGPGFILEDRHHEALMTILNKICAHKPQRPLCQIATRLFDELQQDKIIAQFVPATDEDGFDFLHMFFPSGGLDKAKLQLYAWIDQEDVYCVGIGTEDKTKLAVERIHDMEAYKVAHGVIMEMLSKVQQDERGKEGNGKKDSA